MPQSYSVLYLDERFDPIIKQKQIKNHLWNTALIYILPWDSTVGNKTLLIGRVDGVLFARWDNGVVLERWNTGDGKLIYSIDGCFRGIEDIIDGLVVSSFPIGEFITYMLLRLVIACDTGTVNK